MKYMLMMNCPRNGYEEFGKWPPQAIQAHIEFMKDLCKQFKEEGVLVAAEGLDAPDQAKIVRGGKGGAPVVTDGPFAETKEYLAGWWIVDCEDSRHAYTIAARASVAPGPDGKPMNMPIEVRQVMSAPGDETCGA
jgi:hypothetical protein